MKNLFLPLIICLSTSVCFAQKKQVSPKVEDIETSVVEEGRKLYQLETSTAYGLEIFREQFSDKLDSTAGYFSYKENKMYKCVFFNNLDEPEIIAAVSFDSLFSEKRIKIDSSVRPMKALEKNLLAIREQAIQDIKRDTVFFKLYTGTSISILPVIDGTTKKVYCITKSLGPAAVVFGNDYLFDFDANNFIISRKSLHTDLVSIDCFKNSIEEDENPEKVVHKHKAESGDFITATDVCILLLNQKRANWKHHVVKAPNYVSIWYCDSNELQTVSRKKWNKMNKEEPEAPEQPIAVTRKN